MKKFALMVIVLLSASLVAGCGGDTAESLSKEMVANMKEMGDILTGITDEASAKAALPKIDAVRIKMRDCGARAKEVPPIDDATEERIAKSTAADMDKAMAAIFAAQERLMAKPELMAIIEPALQNMEGDL